MAVWDDYKACCQALAASDRDASFCPECGHGLLRCQAPQCRSLITPLGHCTGCIDLRLSLDRPAVLQARAGESLSVPFVLRNNGSARSLSITSVLRDSTDMTQEAVPLAWEHLEPGRARAFTVETGSFAHGGVSSLRLTIVVATRYDDIEETYAFAGDVAIGVQGAAPTQIVQNIDLGGAHFGTAGMVVANPRAEVVEPRRRQPDVDATVTDVALERAERVEMQRGYRGYDRLAARMPRNVEFLFVGFPAADRPADGPLPHRPIIRCGRNGRAGDAGQNAQPNDLCLRIYDPSGELEREPSRMIPRRVCDLVLQNDRLCVRSVSSALVLNHARLAFGDTRVVSDGDCLMVPAGSARVLAFRTTFTVSGGLVTRVRIQKVP